MTTMQTMTTVNTYTLTSPDGDTLLVRATSLAAAEDAACEWVGEYAEPASHTTWETITIEGPHGRKRLRVEVEPLEPECTEDDHRWVDGPIYSSGGGICYRDTCSHCGLAKRVDTWTTDPADGSEGHSSIAYIAR